MQHKKILCFKLCDDIFHRIYEIFDMVLIYVMIQYYSILLKKYLIDALKNVL